MKTGVYLSIFALTLSACGTVEKESPIEFTAPTAPSSMPPAGFTGNEWLDSRGCKYDKVKKGELFVWNPRVDPWGSHICRSNLPQGLFERDTSGATQPVATTSAKATTTSAKATKAPVQKQNTVSSGTQIQLGTFAEKPNATRLKARLEKAGYRVRLIEETSGGRKFTIVRIYPKSGQSSAQALAYARSIGFSDAFVIAA